MSTANESFSEEELAEMRKSVKYHGRIPRADEASSWPNVAGANVTTKSAAGKQKPK